MTPLEATGFAVLIFTGLKYIQYKIRRK